jgi:hypothetical protein
VAQLVILQRRKLRPEERVIYSGVFSFLALLIHTRGFWCEGKKAEEWWGRKVFGSFH